MYNNLKKIILFNIVLALYDSFSGKQRRRCDKVHLSNTIKDLIENDFDI